VRELGSCRLRPREGTTPVGVRRDTSCLPKNLKNLNLFPCLSLICQVDVSKLPSPSVSRSRHPERPCINPTAQNPAHPATSQPIRGTEPRPPKFPASRRPNRCGTFYSLSPSHQPERLSHAGRRRTLRSPARSFGERESEWVGVVASTATLRSMTGRSQDNAKGGYSSRSAGAAHSGVDWAKRRWLEMSSLSSPRGSSPPPPSSMPCTDESRGWEQGGGAGSRRRARRGKLQHLGYEFNTSPRRTGRLDR